MSTSKFKSYVKPAVQALRPYELGEDLTGISVSDQDTPELGGMIAVNANNEKDQCYVGKKFFELNYELVEVKPVKVTEVGKQNKVELSQPESTSNLTFGMAINLLKEGCKVSRSGWNGKGMFIILVKESKPVITEGSPYFDIAGLRGTVVISDHIDMYTATGNMQPGWLASQSDMLAEDWSIVK